MGRPAIAFLVLLMVRPSPNLLAGSGELERILALWEQRRNTAMPIKYSLSGTRTWLKGSLTETAITPDDPRFGDPNLSIPPTDVTAKINRTALFDLSNNRYSIEFDVEKYEAVQDRMYRVHCSVVGDRRSQTSRIHANTGPPLRRDMVKPHVDLFVMHGEMPAGLFNEDLLPLFYGHGIVAYNEVRPLPHALIPSLERDDFSFVRNDALDGTPCIVIASPLGGHGTTEFWVDLSKDAAVVRAAVSRPGGKPYHVTDVKYRDHNGRWLVDSWSSSSFSGNRLAIVTSVKVKVEPTPLLNEVSFELKHEVGMYVQEETYKRNSKGRFDTRTRYYRIEANDRITVLDERLLPRSNN